MSEITRASHEDRKRYSEHIAEMYALGYIDDAEAEEMQGKVLQAKEMSQLEKVFKGMPPVAGKKPRWYLPATGGVLSLIIAVVPHSQPHIPVVIMSLLTVLGVAGMICAGSVLVWMMTRARMRSPRIIQEQRKEIEYLRETPRRHR